MRLEQRLARIEQHLALGPLASTPPSQAGQSITATEPTPLRPVSIKPPEAEELEFVVGQNWFASVGALVLTCGVGFALSLPWPGQPAAAPSAFGYLLAAGLLFVARRWQDTFELLASFFRGAGMVLLFFSTLRLFFFGSAHAMEIESLGAPLLLLATAAINLGVAVRQRSPWLLGLAISMGLLAVLVIGTPWVVFGCIALLASFAAWAAVRHQWPGLLVFSIPAVYSTYLLWLINRPWAGRPFQILAEPVVGIYFLLVYAMIFTAGALRRKEKSLDDPATIAAVLFNCGAGYGIFLLQSLKMETGLFTPAHLTAAIVFLGLAVAFWKSEASRIPTFFYAMTGYLALSVAIARHFPSPEVFIWLSAQSLVVVATALWFRSRLIVVANFFIYVAIVLAYMVAAKQESGISLGFGIVALLTARILNWKKERLELRTELMRNAYLASAFVIFPYALYHLMPRAYVSLSWVGVALAYYLMNLMVQNPKYRWMGHLTLLLTVGYVVVVASTEFGSTYRIVSFLVLGTVLLVVSLIFTQVRERRKRAEKNRQT